MGDSTLFVKTVILYVNGAQMLKRPFMLYAAVRRSSLEFEIRCYLTEV